MDQQPIIVVDGSAADVQYDDVIIDSHQNEADTFTAMTEAVEAAMTGDELMMQSLLTEYSVKQIETGPGGQVLDCKVCRDEETGLPRVEMTFSINPLQQQQQLGFNNDAGGALVLGGPEGIQLVPNSSSDVRVTSEGPPTDSTLLSSADVILSQPPPTLYRPDAVSHRSPDSLVTSSSPAAEQEVEVRQQRQETQQCTMTKERCQLNDIAMVEGDELTALKRHLERRPVIRRSMLLIASAVEGRDERATLILVVLVTLLSILLWYASLPVFTTLSLICFIACFLDFIRLQPGVEDFISTFVTLSSDDESRLESFYARMLCVKCRLLDSVSDVRTLKQDRPTAFLLVVVSAFYLIGQLGHVINDGLLIYIIVMTAITTPALVGRICKLTRRV